MNVRKLLGVPLCRLSQGLALEDRRDGRKWKWKKKKMGDVVVGPVVVGPVAQSN